MYEVSIQLKWAFKNQFLWLKNIITVLYCMHHNNQFLYFYTHFKQTKAYVAAHSNTLSSPQKCIYLLANKMLTTKSISKIKFQM